jgi:hypothetical protein
MAFILCIGAICLGRWSFSFHKLFSPPTNVFNTLYLQEFSGTSLHQVIVQDQKSANFPFSREPFSFSSKFALAAHIVMPRKVSSGSMHSPFENHWQANPLHLYGQQTHKSPERRNIFNRKVCSEWHPSILFKQLFISISAFHSFGAKAISRPIHVASLHALAARKE